jgi:multiple antibiotic resistance protein
MSQSELAVNFFVALFALIDPIGCVPMFAAATVGASAASRRIVALYISLFMLIFLTLFYFTGLKLLEFFGISLPAFRIAGGVLLLLLGIDMARKDFTSLFADIAEAGQAGLTLEADARKRFERLVVPFGMPLLIGPGAISSVILYASDAARFGLSGFAAGFGVIFAVSAITLACFLATDLISRVLGRIGMSIVVRVLGLVLCALAVQFIILGLAGATVGLVDASAAHPYKP